MNDIAPEIAIFALAVFWDVMLGEPKYLHPVVWMGSLVSLSEKRAPRRGKAIPFLYGLGMVIVIPGVFALAAYFLAVGLRAINIIAYVLVGSYILKSSFAVKELGRAAATVCDSLEAKHYDGARGHLKSLVSRDTLGLSPDLMASAAIESVAENTTDSFIAPWLAFALFGLPGAIAYRAINTLDSMIGYRDRYPYLGKAAARLDDLLNLIPARLAGLLIVVASCLTRLDSKLAWQTMWQEHHDTESPNAGWTMSAMAGALGVQLEKVGHYKLGNPFHRISPSHIRQTAKVMYWVAAFSFLIALGILGVRYAI